MDKENIAVVMIVVAFLIGAIFYVAQAGAGGIENSKIVSDTNYPYGSLMIDAHTEGKGADVIITYLITLNADNFADKNVKITVLMLNHLETNVVDLTGKTGEYKIQISYYLHDDADCTMMKYINTVHQTPDTIVTGFRLNELTDGYYKIGCKATDESGNIIYFDPEDFYFVKSGNSYGFRAIGLADALVEAFTPTNYQPFNSNGFGPTPSGSISLTWDIDFFYPALFIMVWTIFIFGGVIILMVRRS